VLRGVGLLCIIMTSSMGCRLPRTRVVARNRLVSLRRTRSRHKARLTSTSDAVRSMRPGESANLPRAAGPPAILDRTVREG
jgi:hypothetical protein